MAYKNAVSFFLLFYGKITYGARLRTQGLELLVYCQILQQQEKMEGQKQKKNVGNVATLSPT